MGGSCFGIKSVKVTKDSKKEEENGAENFVVKNNKEVINNPILFQKNEEEIFIVSGKNLKIIEEIKEEKISQQDIKSFHSKSNFTKENSSLNHAKDQQTKKSKYHSKEKNIPKENPTNPIIFNFKNRIKEKDINTHEKTHENTKNASRIENSQKTEINVDKYLEMIEKIDKMKKKPIE